MSNDISVAITCNFYFIHLVGDGNTFFLFISGTISVIYLLGFVTYKSVIWGLHMDFSKVPGSCE